MSRLILPMPKVLLYSFDTLPKTTANDALPKESKAFSFNTTL